YRDAAAEQHHAQLGSVQKRTAGLQEPAPRQPALGPSALPGNAAALRVNHKFTGARQEWREWGLTRGSAPGGGSGKGATGPPVGRPGRSQPSRTGVTVRPGPHALRYSEAVLAILRAGGVPDWLAAAGQQLLIAVVNGFTLDEVSPPPGPGGQPAEGGNRGGAPHAGQHAEHRGPAPRAAHAAAT